MIDPLRNPIFSLCNQASNHDRQWLFHDQASDRGNLHGSTLIAIIVISEGMCEQAEHVKSRRHKK